MTGAAELKIERSVPVRHRVDVFVAGGGPAGVAAAVAAARQGRSVFVAEGQGCFGGMGTAGGLATFCHFTDLQNFVAGGVGQEIYDRLWDAHGMAPHMKRQDPHWAVFYKPEVLKRICDDLVQSSGAGFGFFTNLIGVEVQGGQVSAALCWGKSGLFAVQAKVYVDCTGDGDLAAWAGATFEKGGADGLMQPPTLCSVWANVDHDAATAAGFGPWKQEGQLPRAFGKGVFTVEDPHLPGMMPVAPNVCYGNIGHVFGIDATDERDLTRAMVDARRRLPEYERFYKEYLKGYEKMELVGTGSLLGVRETRRILGDYVLNVEDYRRRAVFEDEIGRFAYMVDIHASRPEEFEKTTLANMHTLKYQAGESYGIPYRCLTPRGLSNVLVAGRCVSVDRYILGSLRVMPGCYITGQAAGVAAAIAAAQDQDVHQVSVHELQARLKALGAYLPNARA